MTTESTEPTSSSRMHARLVNTAAEVIARAMENGRQTPAGWAVALDSACLLQSPETAAELAALQARLATVHRMPQDNVTAAEVRLGQYRRPPRTFETGAERDLYDIAAGLQAALGEVREQRDAARLRAAELEEQLAEYERPADEDPITYTLTNKTPDDVTPQVTKLRALLAGQREQAGGAS